MRYNHVNQIKMKLFLFLILCSFSISMFAQMTEREQAVLDEINLLRSDPTAYIQYIEEYLDYWNADAAERATAAELKRELRKTAPMNKLEFSNELYANCTEHGNFIVKTKKFAHSNFNIAENIQYGNENPRFAVLDLLIDHGVPDRGHRKNLLNSSFTKFAVYEIPASVDNMSNIFIQQFRK